MSKCRSHQQFWNILKKLFPKMFLYLSLHAIFSKVFNFSRPCLVYKVHWIKIWSPRRWWTFWWWCAHRHPNPIITNNRHRDPPFNLVAPAIKPRLQTLAAARRWLCCHTAWWHSRPPSRRRYFFSRPKNAHSIILVGFDLFWAWTAVVVCM